MSHATLASAKAGSKYGHVGAGTYRHLQARLRNNAESVAFYGGVEKEGRLIKHKFKDLLRHHARLLTKQWQYGMVQVSSCSCSLACRLAAFCHNDRVLAAPTPVLGYATCSLLGWLSVLSGFTLRFLMSAVDNQHCIDSLLSPGNWLTMLDSF